MRSLLSAAPLVGLTAFAVCTSPSPSLGAGFDLGQQSSKGMAMAGAFVAQAEDPSAIFYNVAALTALGEDAPTVTAGLATFNLGESFFQGLPPGVGAGTNAEQESLSTLTGHAYFAQAVGDSATLGVGLYSPYSADTDWAMPDAFAGRFNTLSLSLATLDLVAGTAVQVTEGLSVGGAVIFRTSELTHARRLQSFDPSAGAVVDVASARVEATLDNGTGWSAGVLQQVGPIALGASYRSAIEIDYDGEARLQQIPTGNTSLDALIAATLPLEMDLSFRTLIEFPESTSVGIATAMGEGTVVEVGGTWTGWSSIAAIDLLLPNNPELDQRMPQAWVDSATYRLGTRMEGGGGSVLRFGVAFEESPVPDETLGPFLADEDRFVYSVGFSKDWLDLAFVWMSGEGRSTQVNIDDFNGNYSSNAWLFGLTINL